jgi:hypothetical protein
MHRMYAAFEPRIPRFFSNDTQAAEQGYSSVFHKVRLGLPTGCARHCEEPLRRSNPVFLVARAVWIASRSLSSAGEAGPVGSQ